MNRTLQNCLIGVFRTVKATRVLDTSLGGRLFEASYGFYKARLEAGSTRLLRHWVRPATVVDVSKALGNNTSVGALMSIDRAGSAANRPNRRVNAKDSGAIRNGVEAYPGCLAPMVNSSKTFELVLEPGFVDHCPDERKRKWRIQMPLARMCFHKAVDGRNARGILASCGRT